MAELNQLEIETLASNLYEANETNKQIKPLSKSNSNLTIEDAYNIQLINIEKREGLSNKRVGKKIGLTSKAMQESLGVDESDYDILLKDMEIDNSNPVVNKESTIQPRVEGELAFILKSELKGPNISVEEVLSATESIVPSMEVEK